jgi:molecular chaperone GrpE
MQQAGVERVDVQTGEPFDPHLHEAMMRHPAEGVMPGHVTMSMQPGYVFKGRTLRPAKVAVAPEE